MSLNTIADRRHEVEIAALLTLLNKFIMRWRGASTIEDKIIIESQTVRYFEKFINNELGLPDVSSLTHPNSDDFGQARIAVKYKTDMCMTRLRKLSEMYIRNFNTKVKLLMELTGSLKRVRQKKAALDLWDREKAKWVIAEKFLNLDNINSTHSGATVLNADVSQGILTLPVETTTQVLPRNIRITSGNGFIGNSDIDVTTNNIKPEFIFDGNADTWFEYERLDSGPAEMSLTIDFSAAEIVNLITIRAVNLGAGLNYEVEDIIFGTAGVKTVSIKELVGNNIKPEDFIVKTIGNDIYWQMSFLPVTCTNATIKFKQENYYRAEMLSGDARAVTRKRYPIGIKSMIISRQKFKINGGLSSSYYTLPPGLYAAESSSSIFPRKNKLYNAFLDLSTDNGESWNLDVFGFEDTSTPNTVMMDGIAGTALWRLYVERNDAAFKDTSSYTDEDISTMIKVFSRRVAPAVSPALITLNDKPYNKEVGVFQPQICRRTDDPREAIRIGRSPSGTVPGEGFVLSLPIELDAKGYNLDPEDMVVYGNRVYIQYSTSSAGSVDFDDIRLSTTGVDEEIWAINNDWTRIALQVNKEHAEISWRFPSEQLQLEQRSDGFYAPFSSNFDPDKKRIRLTGLSAIPEQSGEILPLAATSFDLKKKQIIEGTLNFTQINFNPGGTTLTFTRKNRKEVRDGGSADGEIWYYVDLANGKLYFDETIAANGGSMGRLVKVSYECYLSNKHADEDYKVWAENLDLKGIIIAPDKVVAKDIEYEVWATDSASFFAVPFIDLNTGKTTTKSHFFAESDYAIDLPYDYIVKGSVTMGPDFFANEPEAPAPYQVDYIDGLTEFLGLINMDYESTVEMTSDGTGVIQFKLAAGAAWYTDLGVDFGGHPFTNHRGDSAAALEDDVVGDYTIDSDGVVSVRIENIGSVGTLPGGIPYKYSYIDPSFDPSNLVSIDYEKGIVYASETIQKGPFNLTIDGEIVRQDTPIVKFKVARYKAEYDIVRPVDSFNYSAGSNSVSINTENLEGRLNKRVKVYYAVPEDFVPLRDMKEYFSPLIYNISFRFQ
jgi:hypothetical protein